MKSLYISLVFIVFTQFLSAQSTIFEQEKKAKFATVIEPGLAYGLEYQEKELSFHFKVGTLMKQRYFVGIGSGVKSNERAETLIIPMFLDFRMDILKKQKTPYFNVLAGADYMFSGYGIVGPILGIGGGYKLGDYENIAIILGLNFEIITLREQVSTGWGGGYVQEFGYKQIRISAGLVF